MVDTHTSNLSGGSGYWSQAATWSSTGGGIPTAGDSVTITAGDTVYYDIANGSSVSLAALAINGTLRVVTASTPADGAIQSTNPTRVALGMQMASNVSITGTGAFYIGNSAADPIARPAAVAAGSACVPNFILTLLSGTGILLMTGTPTFRAYGWIPSAVTAHPDYTTIATYTDTSHIVLTDTNLELQVGDMITVGSGANGLLPGVQTTDTQHGVYLVYGISGTTIQVSPAFNSNVRAAGDYVGVYNRPILFNKATYNNTRHSVANTIMQGVRVNNMRWSIASDTQYQGCTFGIGDAVTPAAAADLGVHDLGAWYLDCVFNNSAGSYASSAQNNRYDRCLFTNAAQGVIVQGIKTLLDTCVWQNCAGGLGVTSGPLKAYRCVSIANTNGGFGDQPVDCEFYQCTSSFCDSYGDLMEPQNVLLDGCSLLSTVSMWGFSSGGAVPGTVASYAPTVSLNHGGTAGLRKTWTAGGTGTTNDACPLSAYPNIGTMHFTKTSTSTQPMLWQYKFWMPANKTLTFEVPMYTGVADTTMNAELWIVDPENDPLWFDPVWINTVNVNSTRPSAGAATGNVLARSVMPTATRGVWNQVPITVPAQSAAKNLIVRVICKATTGAQNCYIYIDAIEAALMKKRRIFL